VDLHVIRNEGGSTPRGLIVGALIAVVVVGGLVALAMRHPLAPTGIAGGSAPPNATGIAPTSGPIIRPTPEAPDPWDLQRVAVPLSSTATSVRKVLTVGDAFIALVDDFAVTDGPASALMRSTDGTAWEEIGLPEEGRKVAAGTLVGGDLWLVVSDGQPDAPTWHLWSTPDGSLWVDRGSMTGLVPKNGILTDVAGGEAGFVATVAEPPIDQDHPGVEQVRYSADGRKWERIPMPEFDANTHLVGFTATDDGWLLAADFGDGPASYELRVLASVDGRTWSSTAVAAMGEGLAVALATGQSGYLLGGADGSSASIEPVVWTSTDGVRWARVGLGVPAGRDGAVVVGGLSTERGFVLFGNRGGDAWSSPRDTGVWSYRDVYPPGVDAFLGSMAVRGDILVAGGATDSGVADLWVGSLSALGL
jgi:hypothetical protein